jgi:hypothetical protein
MNNITFEHQITRSNPIQINGNERKYILLREIIEHFSFVELLNYQPINRNIVQSILPTSYNKLGKSVML